MSSNQTAQIAVRIAPTGGAPTETFLSMRHRHNETLVLSGIVVQL